MSRTPDQLPDDLAGVGEALESHRPRPTAMELDRVKRRAMAGATGSSHRYPKDSFMRSRLAVASMLVAGFTMSGAGAALGTSALSAQNESASAAQYGTPPVTPPPQGTPPVTPPPQGTPPVTPPPQGTSTNTPPEVLGEVISSGEDAPPPLSGDTLDDTTSDEGTPSNGTLGQSASGEGPTTAAVQEPRQLSAGDGEVGAQSAQLPFTGYASVPLLIMGLALLVTGFVLRRSTGRGAPQG